MKRLMYFVFGAVLGLAACIVVVYLATVVLEFLNIHLDETAAERRNMLYIFLGISGVVALVCGLLFLRKTARS